MKRRGVSGQSTVEMMLYISVMVMALVLSGWIFFGPDFEEGFQEMQSNTETVFTTDNNASGDRR